MSEELVKKSNTTSAVWTYFGFVPDEKGKPKDEDTAVCMLCSKKVSSKSSNTTNLFSHLRTNHPSEYVKAKDVKKTPKTTGTSSLTQPTIEASLSLEHKYERTVRMRYEYRYLVVLRYIRLTIYHLCKMGYRPALPPIMLDPTFSHTLSITSSFNLTSLFSRL